MHDVKFVCVSFAFGETCNSSFWKAIGRSDFDEFGYDVLAQIEGEEKITKLQLKAFNGKASNWDIHKSLLQDDNGNVVVIKISSVNEGLCFDYLTITNNNRMDILSRLPKKANEKKCKLNKYRGKQNTSAQI